MGSPVFPQMGQLLFQTNFLAVDISLGYLSMKNFLDRTNQVSPKIRQRERAGGIAPPSTEQKLTYFLTMKMIFSFSKIFME